MNIRRGGGQGPFTPSDDSERKDPFAVGSRQYAGDPEEIWDNLAKDLDASTTGIAQGEHTKKRHEFALSPADEEKLQELHRKKVGTIQEITPKYQRRIRNSLNEKRKLRNQSEISYEEINPMKTSFKKKYAQLIVNEYNTVIDHTIHNLHDEKLYEHELQRVQRCNKEQLKKKLQKIPQEVRSEIVQQLNINPQSITAYKKDVQKKIVATFNAFY